MKKYTVAFTFKTEQDLESFNSTITKSLKEFGCEDIMVKENEPYMVVPLDYGKLDALLKEVFGKNVESVAHAECSNDSQHLCRPHYNGGYTTEVDIKYAIEAINKGRGWIGMDGFVDVLRVKGKLEQRTTYLVTVSW